MMEIHTDFGTGAEVAEVVVVVADDIVVEAVVVEAVVVEAVVA